jgi:hypothetical protein
MILLLWNMLEILVMYCHYITSTEAWQVGKTRCWPIPWDKKREDHRNT